MIAAFQETKIKGYINVVGYKVVADENVDPGRYGFKIIHDVEKTHFFSHDEQLIIREWMKALMKATISRDFSSKCSVLLFPLNMQLTWLCRPRSFLEQYSYHSSHGCPSNEPFPSAAFADCACCDATCAPER